MSPARSPPFRDNLRSSDWRRSCVISTERYWLETLNFIYSMPGNPLQHDFAEAAVVSNADVACLILCTSADLRIHPCASSTAVPGTNSSNRRPLAWMWFIRPLLMELYRTCELSRDAEQQ